MTYILKDLDNKTVIIKTSKELKDITSKSTLFEVIDSLYNNGYITLDNKENFEFGTLYIPRNDELEVLSKFNFKVFDLTNIL